MYTLHNKLAKIRCGFILFAFAALFFVPNAKPFAPLAAQTNSAAGTPSITSESFIDWRTNIFSSDIQLNMNKAGFSFPSGRTAAVKRIHQQLLLLIKNPLLTITVDSSTRLGDLISGNTVGLDDLTGIIDGGLKLPGVYGKENETLTMEHTIMLHDISSRLVLHKTPYSPKIPIDSVSSRIYTGIVIDARGALPVHGEFSSENAAPCLFPKIWDTDMNLLYERNMVDPAIVRKNGPVTYGSLTSLKAYADRVGKDPLYIAAKEIFGIYRTDPVISRNDALKILSIAENHKLLAQGKIVILLDEGPLTHAVAAPLKDEDYYSKYDHLEQFVHKHKIPDVKVKDEPPGMRISIHDLKFKADSAVLLPEETKRLDLLAQSLKKATLGTENTILVEGHTASVGKARGEQDLSVQRARAVVAEMVKRGVDEKLFTYRGYGGTRPVPGGDNSTEEGRALNRRVEITVIPQATFIQRAP